MVKHCIECLMYGIFPIETKRNEKSRRKNFTLLDQLLKHGHGYDFLYLYLMNCFKLSWRRNFQDVLNGNLVKSLSI